MPDGYIFISELGSPIRRNSFGTACHRSARAAGPLRSATFHDLRHFYASLLIRQGESVVVVPGSARARRRAAGTLDTHSHLWPDSDDTTQEGVEAPPDVRAGQGVW